MLPNMVGAVIYVRVSTKEQTENLSLPTQVKACEEYCERQGFQVLARFREEGESAKTADRTELQKLLQFCRKNKRTVQFVVVFNLTRFAREKYDHFALRAYLKSLGISLRSATEPIDDTSTGKLMEGVLAAFAEFDNDVRSERTRGGMKAALELGRWTFLAPLGYVNAPRSSGKSLVVDPERAPLVRRAFQDYATGRFTKDEVRKSVNALGLRTRRGKPVPSQTFDAMLRNRVYIGRVDVRDFNVSTRGDFDPLVTDRIFFRVQAILNGRNEVTASRQRNDPDFPLRGYVRCETCGKTLTASWSKGRSDYYAYYHCRGRCRAVNISKARLEELFVDELARLQPTPGFLRLVKDRVLSAWRAMQGDAKQRIAEIERKQKAIREKLDRLDQAFLFERTIDIDTYDRHRDKLREELTLARIDRHSGHLKNSTWKASWRSQNGFCRASDLWVQASLDQRQRFQQRFFPDGIAFDGNRFVGTGVTAPACSYLREIETEKESLACQPKLRGERSAVRLRQRLRRTTFARVP
jgi:DNA invertase Pin-like site-specific DNA recombinase